PDLLGRQPAVHRTQRLYDRHRLHLALDVRDDVAVLVAARRRDRAHAGVVAPRADRLAVLARLLRAGAPPRQRVDLVHDAALRRAQADDEPRDAELARRHPLADGRRIRVAAVGEQHDRLAALDHVLERLLLGLVLGIEALAAQRIAAG